MTSKQCAVWDLTIRRFKTDGMEMPPAFIGDSLKKLFKFFIFQAETGEKTGYRHYQFRGSLFKKTYQNPLLKMLCDALKVDLKDAPTVSPTVGDNTKNFDYVLKQQTREDDKSYRDSDFKQAELKLPDYVPVQYRGLMDKLRPYQKQIFDTKDIIDRKINVIYDPVGNKGKSTTAELGQLFCGGFALPPFNDSKELLQCICDYGKDNNLRQISPIFVDMPRAMNQKELAGLYQGIETLKNGRTYDPRHHFTSWMIDSPQIWIFTNTIPNLEYVSHDRWQIWQFNEKFELIPFVEEYEPDFIDDEDNIISPTMEEKRLSEKLKTLRKSIKEAQLKKLKSKTLPKI